ncbi:hypothetical protein ABFS82_04G159400 [Erythranthe guttata]|uniref:Pectinesterase inhibitor domain-containing protein n=1 Tax=Erythranthe guttata TaxID=4155 RepID=A0A022QAX8_ERYGU|nr:hypothetical protein MIMGU_mgv1a026825mg [Erythranthe guttata]
MDSANPTFNSDQKSRRLQSVRTRNKIIIIIFFSLIMVLAVIIGGIIISLAQKINSQSPYPNVAILEFCTVSYSEFSCINSVSAAIKTRSNTDPNGVFFLSLKTSLKQLSGIISAASNETRPGPGFADCLTSLGRAAGRLGSVLDAVRVNPDLEARTSDQRREMSEWIGGAAEDLAVCVGGDLGGKVESTALDGAAALVGYSKEFLADSDVANENFRFALANGGGSRNQVVEDLIAVSFFVPQYFVLALLFCLLLRIY